MHNLFLFFNNFSVSARYQQQREGAAQNTIFNYYYQDDETTFQLVDNTKTQARRPYANRRFQSQRGSSPVCFALQPSLDFALNRKPRATPTLECHCYPRQLAAASSPTAAAAQRLAASRLSAWPAGSAA